VTGIPVGDRDALFLGCPIVVDSYARVTSSEPTRRTYVPSHSI
jgi:hypothetical protein